jgi:hypothetical protein
MTLAHNPQRISAGKNAAPKPLGRYFVEAGLLNEDQISVALADQSTTGMRFGEVLVARGWMKEQTVEYLMHKVVLPERKRLEAKRLEAKHLEAKRRQAEQLTYRQTPDAAPSAPAQSAPPAETGTSSTNYRRKDAPISKPLPSVNSVDSDVSWVG